MTQEQLQTRLQQAENETACLHQVDMASTSSPREPPPCLQPEVQQVFSFGLGWPCTSTCNNIRPTGSCRRSRPAWPTAPRTTQQPMCSPTPSFPPWRSTSPHPLDCAQSEGGCRENGIGRGVIMAIAAATATSEVPHADTFSPWDGDNMPLEGPEVQECLAGPCRGVWEVTAIASWGRKGELTSGLGQQGPHISFYCTFSYYNVLVLQINTTEF